MAEESPLRTALVGLQIGIYPLGRMRAAGVIERLIAKCRSLDIPESEIKAAEERAARSCRNFEDHLEHLISTRLALYPCYSKPLILANRP